MCDVYCQEDRSGEFTGNHEVGNKSLQYISNPKNEFTLLRIIMEGTQFLPPAKFRPRKQLLNNLRTKRGEEGEEKTMTMAADNDIR